MINYLHQEQNWQSQLSDLITDPLELLNLLELSTDQLLSGAILASEKFKLRVPRAFVGKMNAKDPLDPLLLQVLPHHLELEEHPEFVTDPLGEEAANQLPGVLHKYKSRFTDFDRCMCGPLPLLFPPSLSLSGKIYLKMKIG